MDSNGEPLRFKLATRSSGDRVPDGYPDLHPVVWRLVRFAGGRLNLFPIGQFDGGHISTRCWDANPRR